MGFLPRREKSRKAVTASRATESGLPNLSVHEDWDSPSPTKPTFPGDRKFTLPPSMAAEQAAKAKESAWLAETTKQHAAAHEASLAWDKTPEGKKHNADKAWANRDKNADYVVSIGGQSQSAKIYNQRG
jgi:hypothetical protein